MSKKLSTQEKARRLWVRALRSEEYGWGKSALHPEEGKYCCLGVLCEVAVKEGIIDTYDPLEDFLTPYDEVMKWVGINEDNGCFGSESLSEINDSAKRNPFKKIANIIEKKPAGLFVEDSK